MNGKAIQLHDQGCVIDVDIRRTTDGSLEQEDIATLLGAMVSQARRDGMNGIELSALPVGPAMRMRYIRARSSTDSGAWEVTPPSVEVFVAILKWVFAHARFEVSVPIKGILAAKLGKQGIRIRAELGTPYDLQLSWGDE